MSKIGKVNEIAQELNKLRVEQSKLGWTLYTVGYDFGVEENYRKLSEAYKNKDLYGEICKAMELDLDPVDKRRVEIMYNSFSSYHLSEDLNQLDLEIKKKVNELSKVLNTFRYTFEGRQVSSVELSQVMTSDENRERRKAAFFARNQINKPLVDAGFIELVKLRKEYAKKYGSENFIAYMLERNELDKDTFDSWLPQLHTLLPKMAEVRTRYAKEFLNDDVIMPWDEGYINSKIAPSLDSSVDMTNYYSNIKELFDTFGFDISKYNITYDIFPRANKSEWGYNFTIDTGMDSRILANVKNKFNEYGVLLHETGHAVHSFLKDPDELILNMGISGIVTEGIANLFGGFLYQPEFYGKFFTDKEKVDKEFAMLSEYKKLNSLRTINTIFFDHAFYKNDVETLDDIYELYWKTRKEVLNEEPFGQEPPWAFLIHHTTHPIYYHNYFMGDVTCEMLSKVFEERFDAKIFEKPLEFGKFLVDEVIKPSGLHRYNDLFKRISGKDFSLEYMID